MKQDTAWYERQLINTQFVGEFRFDRLSLDLRCSYANWQRESPFVPSFTYVRTKLPTSQYPTGDQFVNDLGVHSGAAPIAFYALNANLWSGHATLHYKLAPLVTPPSSSG